MIRTVEVPLAGPGFNRQMMSAMWLGALPGAVSCGRLHLKHRAREWGLAHLVDDAEVVVSELLTNAVIASTTYSGPIKTISLRLYTDGSALLIEVTDWSLEVPCKKEVDVEAIGARGLVLIDALSSQWGYYFTSTNRKVVWAIL
jgi:anti-sigma regulatory factor (Ser/Thr protein kinase)